MDTPRRFYRIEPFVGNDEVLFATCGGWCPSAAELKITLCEKKEGYADYEETLIAYVCQNCLQHWINEKCEEHERSGIQFNIQMCV